MAKTEEDREMWRLFEDCNEKQGDEVERMRHEYKERSKRLGKAKTELPLPAGNIPRGRSPMELLESNTASASPHRIR